MATHRLNRRRRRSRLVLRLANTYLMVRIRVILKEALAGHLMDSTQRPEARSTTHMGKSPDFKCRIDSRDPSARRFRRLCGPACPTLHWDRLQHRKINRVPEQHRFPSILRVRVKGHSSGVSQTLQPLEVDRTVWDSLVGSIDCFKEENVLTSIRRRWNVIVSRRRSIAIAAAAFDVARKPQLASRCLPALPKGQRPGWRALWIVISSVSAIGLRNGADAAIH